MNRLLVLAALLFALPAHATVTFDWVTVGDPGNACDSQSQGCFGAVSYEYQISKYEVTNAQYAAFLNAVAATDTNGLYNANMGDPNLSRGGIARSGSPGSYTYSVIAGRGNRPVNWVSFYDALRFANWLHNGQPTGAQDGTTTEYGAYNMYLGSSVVRRAGARVFLTSEDEWYKAAYYDAGLGSYYDYPAGSDTLTTCAVPGSTPNTANCNGVGNVPTDVGSYTGSASPYGTFDQGGNVWEWNEAIIGSYRGLRAGCFDFPGSYLKASNPLEASPTSEYLDVGLRVASPGPPPVPALGPMGLLLVAAGLLGFGAYRRGRA